MATTSQNKFAALRNEEKLLKSEERKHKANEELEAQLVEKMRAMHDATKDMDWADIDDEDEDDGYYDFPMAVTSGRYPAGGGRDADEARGASTDSSSEDDDEEDDDDDDENADTDRGQCTDTGADQKRPVVRRQLTKREQKLKEIDDFESALAEYGMKVSACPATSRVSAENLEPVVETNSTTTDTKKRKKRAKKTESSTTATGMSDGGAVSPTKEAGAAEVEDGCMSGSPVVPSAEVAKQKLKSRQCAKKGGASAALMATVRAEAKKKADGKKGKKADKQYETKPNR